MTRTTPSTVQNHRFPLFDLRQFGEFEVRFKYGDQHSCPPLPPLDDGEDEEEEKVDTTEDFEMPPPGLKVYNAQKKKQIKRQIARMEEIEETMKYAAVLQRQIPPLSRRMHEGLSKFVELDLPFRTGERTERLKFIQDALDNPTVSPAEKLRQVLEGFNVEAEYGRKIDTYKDTVIIDDQEREVNILRVGRMVLAYQTTDLDETGIWNKETKSWESLPGRYQRPVRDGISMAKKLKTVGMLELPVPAAEVIQ